MTIFTTSFHSICTRGGEDNNGPGSSATGPMIAENVSGSEVDMDNSGFAGKPPAATNSEAAHTMARRGPGGPTCWMGNSEH